MFEIIIGKLESTLSKIKNSSAYQEAKVYMFTKSAEEAGYNPVTDDDLKNNLQKPLKFAFSVLAVGFGFFVVWGGIAPLDSAAIAEGVIIVSSNHQNIQNLKGGIIDAIYVKDGQEVKKGELLMKLNETEAYADYQIATSQLAFLKAENLRLKAEQLDEKTIDWQNYGFNTESMEVAQIIRTQMQLFKNNRNMLYGNINILNEQIKQKQEEIKGLEARLESNRVQLINLREELAAGEELLTKGLYTKPRILELRSRTAEAEGMKGQIAANIAASRQAIAENDVKILNIENDYRKRLNDEIKENHSKLLDVTEKFSAAKEAYERTNIISPVDGIVSELKYHTVGGVVGPGNIIMDIVPKHDKLIIEAKVKTNDIESIQVGMIAKVQIGAYKARLIPRMDGTVIYVGADKAVETQGQQGQFPHYIARIQIDEKDLDKLTADIKLYPGMPATVFLVKGSRTFLQYLISPIRDSFYRAFKEQ